jgi:hypothetical protein
MQFYAKLLEKFLEPYLTYLGKLLYKENHVMIILPMPKPWVRSQHPPTQWNLRGGI